VLIQNKVGLGDFPVHLKSNRRRQVNWGSGAVKQRSSPFSPAGHSSIPKLCTLLFPGAISV
jgi:hypothetical protein